MKGLFVWICLVLASVTGAYAQDAATINRNAPQFKFAGGDIHDFGTIKEGPDAVYVFVFTNTGKEPLRIHDVSASCSCTVPDWSKNPVLPGKTGKITVHYKTAGRPGVFNRDIFIMSNALVPMGRERYQLQIKGTVLGDGSKTTPVE